MKAGIEFCAVATLVFAGAAAAQHEHHAPPNGAMQSVALLEDAAAKTYTLRLGPVNLPANTHHDKIKQPAPVTFTIPFDGWITAYHPRLVDDAGNAVPGRTLHHVAFWNTERPDFLCPVKDEHIFGAGGEMNDWPALPGYGYRVHKGDTIRVDTMFHNPTATGYTQTYIEVKMEYALASDGVILKSVYPTWFDVQQCGNSGYDLWPGANITTGEFTLKYSGRLLGVGGHMHDFGQRLLLLNATSNDAVAALDAQLDDKGAIQSMPIVTFLERGGYRLLEGTRLRVTATYENLTGKHLRQGAMGIVVGYFLPDEDAKLAALRRAATAKK